MQVGQIPIVPSFPNTLEGEQDRLNNFSEVRVAPKIFITEVERVSQKRVIHYFIENIDCCCVLGRAGGGGYL